MAELDERLTPPRVFGIYRGRLVSGFNHWRPGAPAQQLHKGWDVAAATGTNIRALGRCRVVRARDHHSVSGYHQEVTVWYESAMAYTLYGHVGEGLRVGVGDELDQGDIIATVGTSRDAMGTAPHAHIQCWKTTPAMQLYSNDLAIDPARIRSWYAPDR